MKTKIVLISLLGLLLFSGNAFAVELDKNLYKDNEPIYWTQCDSTANQFILYNLTAGEYVQSSGSCCGQHPCENYNLRDEFPISFFSYSFIEADADCLNLTYEECKVTEEFRSEFLFSVSSFSIFPLENVASNSLAYTGNLFAGISPLLYLVIGLPVAFWIINKVVGLVRKREK